MAGEATQPSENTKPNNGHRGTQNLVPWKPGQTGNPGGRPKGLAGYIRDQTMDGRELADFLISVMRGEFPPLSFRGSERLKACEMLLNRGFGQQPLIEGDPNIKPVLDLAKLTPQELDFIENVRLGLIAIGERIKRGEAETQPQ